MNHKLICDDVIYIYLTKHDCPTCGTRLGRTRVSRIVNSKSEEAKDFDFGFVDYDLRGDVKFY